jgi:hypothetical protein
MTEHEAIRTLVKSPPELWAECSDAASLARHLGQFGEIRITRLEPETAVAWEGENASGTVRLEPSGWGTRVILTARPLGADPPHVPAPPEAPATSEAAPPPAPLAASGTDPASDPLRPAPRSRLFGRLFGFLRRAPAAPAAPATPPAGIEGAVEESPDTIDSQAALDCALDSLGQAHHRPFSRA